MKKTILDYETVRLNDERDCIEIIDQTKLPEEIKIVKLRTQEDIRDAISRLAVRGAPAIGITGGFALYLASKEISYSRTHNEVPGSMEIANDEGYSNDDIINEFFVQLNDAKEYINLSRPTAVDLSWALNKTYDAAVIANEDFEGDYIGDRLDHIVYAIKMEAMAIYSNNIDMCKSIGEHALTLVKAGDTLLTHCNAGKLATVDCGTATAVMYLGKERGYNFKIYCDETRPLLQGSRLTAFELSSAGMDVTLACDNMSASLMKEGKIDAIFVGCDRVAANGDTANKIGTLLLAIAAKRYNVPFYVCAPSSTIDFNSKTGADIVIEQRDFEEVTSMWFKKPMAPEDINVYNPAFDVTDADLITAIITENGIAYAPFEDSLRDLVED